MLKFKEYNFKTFSLSLVTLILAFGGIGMFLIQRLQESDEAQFEKQVLGYGLGLVFMLMVAMIDYHFICKLYIPLYIFNLALLLFCRFTDKSMGLPIYGDAHYNAKRWIEIKLSANSTFEFMPSEFTKIIMIIVLATIFDMFYTHIKKFWLLLLVSCIMAIPTVLVLTQTDLSTSIVMFAFFAVMVFAAGTSYKHILPIIAIGIPLVIFLFWYVQQDFQVLLEPYQVKRILGTDMYQQDNAAIAIREGGMFGKILTGDTGSRASDYVPVVESDFIFSAIGEEFGFVGMFFIIGGYLLFALIGLRIAQRAKDYLGSMIAIGITALISVQAFVNIGVVTSLLPNTGIPLPFISSGLTALLCNLATIGILLNISLQPKQKEKDRVIELTDYGMVR